MPKDFVIGIGGTGAKCVEHMVHLCASGLDPNEIAVGLIDQDAANGNVQKTLRLLTLYESVRARFRGDRAGQGVTQANRLDAGCPFLRPDVKSLGNWKPIPDDGQTLAQLFPGAVNDLTKVLFGMDLSLALTEGFRGRPSLGAAVIHNAGLAQVALAAAGGAHTLWQHLHNSIAAATAANPVSIVLVGSIFGGTGAAGLPSVAKLITRIAQNNPNLVRVHMVVMLPYFDVPAGNDAQAAQNLDLAVQAKAALSYYATNALAAVPLKGLYVIGSEPRSQLTDFHSGNQAQKNPPLIPEFYAALAAIDALSNVRDGDVLFVGRNLNNEVSWHDLPPDQGASVKPALASLIRFASAFHHVLFPLLKSQDGRTSMTNLLQYWELDPDMAVGEETTRLDKLCDELLCYALELERESAPIVTFFSPEGLRGGGGFHSSLISGDNDKLTLNDMLWNAFYSEKTVSSAEDAQGVGRIVSRLYAATRVEN